MKVKIKRFDSSFPLPEYKSPKAACVDLTTRETTSISPHEIGYIKLNIAVHIPKGHFGMLLARSSLHKTGLMPVNGIGIIDEDYSGNEDEWMFAALNFTNKKVTIEKSTRIAQMMILKRDTMQFVEVKTLKNKTRGGFGSTGKK